MDFFIVSPPILYSAGGQERPAPAQPPKSQLPTANQSGCRRLDRPQRNIGQVVNEQKRLHHHDKSKAQRPGPDQHRRAPPAVFHRLRKGYSTAGQTDKRRTAAPPYPSSYTGGQRFSHAAFGQAVGQPGHRHAAGGDQHTACLPPPVAQAARRAKAERQVR